MATREETQAQLDLMSAGVLRHTPEQTYTVADRLQELATRTPEAPFLIWNEQRLSYGWVDAQANRYAHFVLAQGLEPGQVAALMMENRPEFLYLWFALAKLGCTSALINTHISGDALRHALATTSSERLFVGGECLEALARTPDLLARPATCVIPDPDRPCLVPPGCTVLDAPLDALPSRDPGPEHRSAVRGSSTLSLVFTSGTTGLPKAAKITQARWLGVGDGWRNLLRLTADDVFYCVLPLYHVAGLMSLLSNAMACGGSVVLRRRFSASGFWPDVRRYGITVAQYSGEMCRYLFSQPPRPDDRDHRLRVMTGSGLSPAIWREFRERFGVAQMMEGYGGTELNVGLMNVDDRIGSCGRIPFREKSNARLVKYDRDADCHVRTPEGAYVECAPGEIGEMIGMILALPGVTPGRFDGYTDAEATERKILRNVFRPGDAWMRTGDLFRRDEEDYYYFVDRIGDTFRWKSENVSTSEVAQALEPFAGLETITVYGVTVAGHEGRAGMAAIVMQPGKRFDPVAFHALARQSLPGYAVPLFVRLLPAADITATFKLRKVDLQKLGYASAGSGEVWVADPAAQTYVPVTEENLRRLGLPPNQPPPA